MVQLLATPVWLASSGRYMNASMHAFLLLMLNLRCRSGLLARVQSWRCHLVIATAVPVQQLAIPQWLAQSREPLKPRLRQQMVWGMVS